MIALLLRSQLRFGWRAPFSTLSALLGLTLGIASLVAVHLLCERIVASLDRAVPAHLQVVSHLAFAPELGAKDYFALRQRWRAGTLSEITAMAPLRQGQLIHGDASVMVYGIDWIALASAGSTVFGGQGPGFPPPLANQVVAAEELGWATGARPMLAGQRLTVAAVVPTPQGISTTPVLYTDIALAVDLLAGSDPSRLSAVLLQVQDPLTGLRRMLSQLLPGVEAGLPPVAAPQLGPGWRVVSLRSEMPEQVFGRSVLFNLGALGLLSLVVAWFLMLQTALLWLRRQVPVFALLRDQGVPASAQFCVFALTMILLGVLAGCFGLALGRWLASFLMAQFATPQGAEAVALVPGAALLLKTALSAVVVPLLSAALAWRLVLVARSGSLRFGVLLLVLGLSSATALWLARPGSDSLLGAFAAILIVCALAVALLPLVVAALRRLWMRSGTAAPDSLWGSLNLRMGVRELLWYPRELSAALGALSLAVAISIGISTMVDSFRDDFVRMLDQRLVDDVGLQGDSQTLAAAAEWLQTQPDLAGHSYHYQQAQVRVAGQPVQIGRSLLDVRGAQRYGYDRGLGATELLLNQRASRALQKQAGDTLEVGGQTFTAVHVYPGYGDAQLKLLIGAQAPPLRDEAGAPVTFTLESLGVVSDDAQATTAALQARFGALNVRSQQDIRSRSVAVFDQTFAITRSLTLVALLVAAVGLYSALVALGLTQSRTRTLLQYLGQNATERLLYVCGRALAVALITVLIAIPLGLTVAALLCYVVNPRGFGWSVPLQLQWQAIVWPLALAVLAALVAGLMGDRRERL
ncbi:MAG: hypothetical protein AB8B93_02610 [Pseudomonadales bacterium]